jgi:hypothetical protein
MDAERFDRLTQHLGRALSRRRLGGVAAALGLAAGLGAATPADAKPKKKGKKKKKPKSCAVGTVRCGTVCVNPQTDAQHCGGCGNACGNNRACVGGTCQGGGCPSGQLSCGGACVDPQSNEGHCGNCGNACQGNLTCLGGACGCAAGTRCGTECVDTQTDSDHCGSCGNSCQGDLTCLSGQCACAAGTKCGNSCVNTQTNANHCGGCGTTCGSGQTCVGGQCTTAIACANDFQCWSMIAETGGTPKCENGFCRCGNSQAGICTLANGGRRCDVCCPSGSRVCTTRDHVCGSFQTGVGVILTCDCPSGYQICQSDDYGNCSSDFATDRNRCGRDCIDCDQVNPGSACCSGTCTRGNPPGNVPGGGLPCPGNGCQPCPSGTGCCNLGGATAGGCVVLDALGRCPIPPALVMASPGDPHSA